MNDITAGSLYVKFSINYIHVYTKIVKKYRVIVHLKSRRKATVQKRLYHYQPNTQMNRNEILLRE